MGADGLWKWFAVPQYTFADEDRSQELLDCLPLSQDGSPVTQYISLHQRKAHYFWWGNRPFCTHCGYRTGLWRASSEASTHYECMQCGVFRVKRVRMLSEAELMMQSTHEDFGSWTQEASAPSLRAVSSNPTSQEVVFNQMTSIFQYMGDRLPPVLQPDAWRAALMLAKLLGLDCLPPKRRVNLEAFSVEDGGVIDPDVVSCAYIGTRVLDRNAMCWGAFRYWKQVSWQRTQAISRAVLGASMPPPDWHVVLPVLWAEELVAEDLTRAARRSLKREKGCSFGILDALHEAVPPNAIAAAMAFLRVPQVQKTYDFTYWDRVHPEAFREALGQLDVDKALRAELRSCILANGLREPAQPPPQATDQSILGAPASDGTKKVVRNLKRQHKAQELEARFHLLRTQHQQRQAYLLSEGTGCKYGGVLVEEPLMCRLLEGVDCTEDLHLLRDVLRTDMEEHLTTEQRLDFDTNQLQSAVKIDVDCRFLSRANLEAQRAYRMSELALNRVSKDEAIARISARLMPVPKLLNSYTVPELRLQLILWNELALLLHTPFCIEDLIDLDIHAALVDHLTSHITKFWCNFNGDGVEVARPSMRRIVVHSACFCYDVACELPEQMPVPLFAMGGPEGRRLLEAQARWFYRCVKVVEYYCGEGVWGDGPAPLRRHAKWTSVACLDSGELLHYVLGVKAATDPLLGEGRAAFVRREPAADSACQQWEQQQECQASDPAEQSANRRPQRRDPTLPGAAQRVVPLLRQLFSNGEICQPAGYINECSTSQQVVAALQALGMPFGVEEKVLSRAVEELRADSAFRWVYRPASGKDPIQPWDPKCGKHAARKAHQGRQYALYSVRLLAMPAKVAGSHVEAAQLSPPSVTAEAPPEGVAGLQAEAGSPRSTESDASPQPKVRRLLPLTPDNRATLRSPSKEPERLSLAGFETTGQLRERCRAAALELVPAAQAMLADRSLCRAPACLGECSTALEVGRQLLRRLDTPPIGLKYETVVSFVLEQLCEKGVLSRLELDVSGGSGVPLRYTQNPYRCAKRRDAQSGQSSDLWSIHFLSPTADPPSELVAAPSNSTMGPILKALMPQGRSEPVGDPLEKDAMPSDKPPAAEAAPGRGEKRNREEPAVDRTEEVAARPSAAGAQAARRQCRAYAEAVLPAVRDALRQPQGWGHRPPRTLDDCLTTHEFGRRLLAHIGDLPTHLDEDLVMAAIFRRLLKEWLVHRAGQDEGGAVIAVRQTDVAYREDPVSGKSCQLLFVPTSSVCAATCSPRV